MRRSVVSCGCGEGGCGCVFIGSVKGSGVVVIELGSVMKGSEVSIIVEMVLERSACWLAFLANWAAGPWS